MMAWRILLASLVLSLASCTNLMWTSTPVIESPSDFDFGFQGIWVEQFPHSTFDEPLHEFEITRDEEGVHYNCQAYRREETREETKVSFSTLRFSDDSQFAIVQIELNSSGKAYYSYAYATVQDDWLYFWTIKSDALSALLKSEGINSVIDRGIFTTEVTADSAALLELFRKHAAELATESPTVIARRAAD